MVRRLAYLESFVLLWSNTQKVRELLEGKWDAFLQQSELWAEADFAYGSLSIVRWALVLSCCLLLAACCLLVAVQLLQF